jgi:uncharacterized protein (TIGR02271 family)
MAHSLEHAGMHDNSAILMQSSITDAAGQPASILSIERSGAEVLASLRVGDGPQMLVPVSLFAPQADGSYRLPFSLDANRGKDGDTQMTFPVLREEIEVDTRLADTGRGVRLRKTVSVHEQVIDEPLLHDELTVERVPVDALVAADEAPRTRYEGDTLVVPILEEVLVVQKKLRLKEEVRITRHKREVHQPQTVSLRAEHIAVERFDQAADGKGGQS